MWAKLFEISPMDMSDCIPQIRHHFPTIKIKDCYIMHKTTCIALLQPSLLAVFSANCRIPPSVCLISLNSLSHTVSIEVLLWSLLSWYDSTLVCRSFPVTSCILPITYMFHPGIYCVGCHNPVLCIVMNAGLTHTILKGSFLMFSTHHYFLQQYSQCAFFLSETPYID